MIDNKLLKEIQELSKEYDELERNYNPNHKEDDSEEIKSVETDDFLHINAWESPGEYKAINSIFKVSESFANFTTESSQIISKSKPSQTSVLIWNL